MTTQNQPFNAQRHAIDRLTDIAAGKTSTEIPSTALLLESPGTAFQPALTLGSGLPKERNGKRCHYFWKEALAPGANYVDAAGKTFSVSPERIKKIHDEFKLAASRGHEPSLPDSHDASNRKRNFGWIKDAQINSRGNLELLHQFVGDQEKDDALNFKTSICTLNNFVDENGNRYEEFIDHNCITPSPRLNNLGDFVPVTAIAASRGPVNAAQFSLAAVEEISMKLTDSQRERLAKVLPANSTLPDDPDGEAIVKLFESAHQGHATAIAAANEQTGQIRLQLDRTKPKPIDPELAHERYKRTSMGFDALNDKGYAPATVTALKEWGIGTAERPNSLMLSRENPDNITSPIRIEKLIEILASNTPTPPKGVQSGLQLSRAIDPHDADEKEKQARDAGEAQGKKYRDDQLAARGIKP